MYDDIANNKYNPRPGVIINSPNGSDVYAGVPKVYDIFVWYKTNIAKVSLVWFILVTETNLRFIVIEV